MMWIMATSMYASLEASRISSSFEKRRYLPSQANVRSMTQRLGNTTNPFEVRRMISSDQWQEVRTHRSRRPAYPASARMIRRRAKSKVARASTHLAVSRSWTFAGWTTQLRASPSVSTSKCCFLPWTFFPASNPRSPAWSYVLTLWLSSTPMRGSDFRPARRRTCSRSRAFMVSQVPSSRQQA